MNAPQYDDWGREIGFLKPVAAPFPKPTEAELVAELAALRARLVAIEASVDGVISEDGAPITGPDWVRRLKMAVADHWDLSVLELVGRSRIRVITKPRFALCWLLQKVGGYSRPRIAMLVGYDDHTSVSHALRRAEALRTTDEGFRWSTDELLRIAAHLRSEMVAPPTPAPAADEVVS
jgi:hypothetical protein